jgi:hypothetical protein
MVIASSSLSGGTSAPASGPHAGGPVPQNLATYECPVCGQAVDRRHLGEVLHHEVPHHRPIPAGRS